MPTALQRKPTRTLFHPFLSHSQASLPAHCGPHEVKSRFSLVSCCLIRASSSFSVFSIPLNISLASRPPSRGWRALSILTNRPGCRGFSSNLRPSLSNRLLQIDSVVIRSSSPSPHLDISACLPGVLASVTSPLLLRAALVGFDKH